MVDTVLVNRLIESLGSCGDPWNVDFDWKHVFESKLNGSKPKTFESEIYNNPYYHGARINYLFHNKDMTPIEVDSLCVNGIIYPIPVLVDGWHRLFAAHLREDEKIDIYFSGRVDLLDWLTGKTFKQPEY